jgi:hypothetical protein
VLSVFKKCQQRRRPIVTDNNGPDFATSLAAESYQTDVRKKGGILDRRSLLSVAVFLGMLFTGTISANADPNFEIQSLSGEFDNPGLHLALGHSDQSNSGLHLALGQSKGTEFAAAFPGKGGGSAVMSFSVLSVPPDCRIDVSSDNTPGHAPEPATMLLLGTGLAGVAGLMRRKRRVKRS